MPLSKQMERLLCSFSGDSLYQSLSIKKTPDGGFETGGTEGISGVRFVTFALIAVACLLINKRLPLATKTPLLWCFLSARTLSGSVPK